MLARTIFQNKGKIFLFLLLLNVLFFGFQYMQYSNAKKENVKELKKNRKNNFLSLTILTPIERLLDRGYGRKVILRLMKNDCQECMDSIYNNTLRLSRTLGKNSVYVLINGDFNESEYLSIRRLYQYDFNVCYVPEKTTILDTAGNSYYFLFDRKRPLVARSIFRIRNMKEAGHTLLYFSWLSELNNNIPL